MYFLSFAARYSATEHGVAPGMSHNETGTHGGVNDIRNFHRLQATSCRRLVHVYAPLFSRAFHTFAPTCLKIGPDFKLYQLKPPRLAALSPSFSEMSG